MAIFILSCNSLCRCLRGHLCRDPGSRGDAETVAAEMQAWQVLACRAQHHFCILGGCVCAGEELQLCLSSTAKGLASQVSPKGTFSELQPISSPAFGMSVAAQMWQRRRVFPLALLGQASLGILTPGFSDMYTRGFQPALEAPVQRVLSSHHLTLGKLLPGVRRLYTPVSLTCCFPFLATCYL